ncbi:MAG: helix-turn-helix domain-containing protein, partial [Candidatus Kapaibacteriota bacterium]
STESIDEQFVKKYYRRGTLFEKDYRKYNELVVQKTRENPLFKDIPEERFLRFGNLYLFPNAETQHGLIIGAPGKGKSVLTYHIVEQIKNLAERLVILNQTGVINVGSLPTEIIKKNSRKQDNLENQSLKKYLSQIEKELLVKTLEETNYNQTKTAEKLKIPLNTLRSKLKKYGINL